MSSNALVIGTLRVNSYLDDFSETNGSIRMENYSFPIGQCLTQTDKVVLIGLQIPFTWLYSLCLNSN